MRDVQIQILEDNGTPLGVLELESFDDFPLQLSKENSTLNDISARRGNYTPDYKIPYTENNAALLLGVAFINASGGQRNILLKKKANIRIGGNFADSGFIRFSQSTYEGDFTATFFGGNMEWAEELGNVFLNELDWVNSGNDVFSAARIAATNNATEATEDICYPYVDRNVGSGAAQLRPVFYLSKIIKRMFEKIGWTIQSAWLGSNFVIGDGDEYKGVVIDPPFNFTVDNDAIDATRAEVGTNRIALGDNPNSWNTAYILGNTNIPSSPSIVNESKVANFFNVEVSDNSNSWNPVTSEYTAPVSGVYKIGLNASGFQYAYNTGASWFLYNQTTDPLTSYAPPVVYIRIVLNNVSTTVIDGTIIGGGGTPLFTIGTASVNYFLNAGDKVSFWFQMENDAFNFPQAPDINNWRFSPNYNAVINISRSAGISLNDSFVINNHLPKQLSCLDILKDIKLMFNLFFDADVRTKTVTIEPRDDFFLSDFVDITDKINHRSKAVIKHNFPYKRDIVFRFKEDGKDGYLQRWNKLNDRVYGRYIHTLSDRFESGQTVFETKLIAPTIQTIMSPSNIVTSMIKPNFLDVDNAGKGETKEYAMRIYQVIRNQQFDEIGNPRRQSSPLVVSSAMMEEYANVATIDNKKLTFNGVGGLVDLYYRKTLQNIELGALVTVSVKIDLYEFFNWNMRKRVYISEPEQLKGMYIVEAIENYNLVKDELTKVRLLKYRGFAGVALDTSQGTNVSVTTTTNQNDDVPKPLMVIVNGAVVPVLDNNFNQLYSM